MDWTLEVIVLPVADIERSIAFYRDQLGFALDHDTQTPQMRVVQLTPRGSGCSIVLGMSQMQPGSMKGLQLVVSDAEAARAELLSRGVEVSELFHDRTGIFRHSGTDGRVPGPADARADYGSFASFTDPDGNGWLLQEIKTRLPGR